jgi:hypothetical protein
MGYLPRELRGFHTQKEWIAQLNAQKWRCYWCNRIITVTTAQKDHLQPEARGGSDRIENIVGACKPCNKLKGFRNEEEFVAYRVIFSAKCEKKLTGTPTLKNYSEVGFEPSWAWRNPPRWRYKPEC